MFDKTSIAEQAARSGGGGGKEANKNHKRKDKGLCGTLLVVSHADEMQTTSTSSQSAGPTNKKTMTNEKMARDDVDAPFPCSILERLLLLLLLPHWKESARFDRRSAMADTTHCAQCARHIRLAQPEVAIASACRPGHRTQKTIRFQKGASIQYKPTHIANDRRNDVKDVQTACHPKQTQYVDG